jgi:predicted Fe-Mo cluster-binding NifX family protein
MKIALTVFQDRMSPVFDWSAHLLVIEAEGAQEVSRTERSMDGMSLKRRVDLLAEMKVDTLLCGGISRLMLNMVEARGLRVFSWIAGDVEQVLKAFLEGRIPDNEFIMPGCHGMQRRHGNKKRGGQCRRRGKGPDRSTRQ